MTSLTFDAATLVLEIKAGLLDTSFIFTSPNGVKHCATKLHLPPLTSKAYNDDTFHRLKPHTFHWLAPHTFHWLIPHTFHWLIPHTFHRLKTHISQTQTTHISQTQTTHILQTQTAPISQTQPTRLSQTPNSLKQLLSRPRSLYHVPLINGNGMTHSISSNIRRLHYS